MDLNELKKYMDFYKASGVSRDYSSHDGFNATPFNPDADALRWAMQNIGSNGNGGTENRMPNFFQSQGQGGGSQLAAYTAPQQFQGKFQMPQAQQSPLTGQVNNYLASMMGRR